MAFIKIWNRAVGILFTALPILLFCLYGGPYMLYIAFAVILHECAHLAALRLCRGRMCAFHPAPFGLCIEYDADTLSFRGELFVAAAGILANALLAGTAGILGMFFGSALWTFALVNLLIGGMNLLPLSPLDGGRIVYLLIAMQSTPDFAHRIVQFLTHICGLLVFLVASYLLLTGRAGLYPLLFSAYVFAANAKEMSRSEKT